MGKEKVGLYPGTFDPIHNGHLDIIGRSLRLVDKLVIGVAINAGKGPVFTLEERVDMVRRECSRLQADGAVDVRPFSGLVVNFADEVGATILVRGLRSVTDFDYEFQMTGMNARLNPAVETVFLTASLGQQAIASKLIREIAMFGGDIAPFVPADVKERTMARMKERE
ncbi:pantetheine-phosphate adenylyltransferase [Iodidimonas sp. SYSU 1G8]|uniref:pantetheine-phosphate adenylyltransferase n=1 Tax=Iodidimonas sp. SYSU 1G8 TaxID=3133967 RepID=UPI0031FF1CDD